MKIKWCLLSLALSVLVGCNNQQNLKRVQVDSYPELFPDYINVTIPFEIAPLNFRLENSEKEVHVEIKNQKDISLHVTGQDGKINIPLNDWKNILSQSLGDTLFVTVSEVGNEEIKQYKSFYINVSKDSIDRYIVYRMIEPTYANWNAMTLTQRDIFSFDEKILLDNNKVDNNCMNCHTFNNNNPDELVFHSRKSNAGTVIVKDGKVVKLHTKTPSTISHFVYPYWHPSGKTIAFSTNATHMSFFYNNPCIIEVYDSASDIILYDVDKNEVFTSPLLATPDHLESFPFFSPKGEKLYFCVSKQPEELPNTYKEVKYKIASIDFNESTRTFGNTLNYVIDLDSIGMSVSLPSISPDGKYLLSSKSTHGCFLSWNPKADLLLYDLENEKEIDTSLWNSDSSESFTAWSSNGRWVIFTSRRLDDLYNRPFIAHIDEYGNLGKPFLLPQKDLTYYDQLFKAFNMPKFIKNEFKMSDEVYDVLKRSNLKPVTFDPNSYKPIVKHKKIHSDSVN